MQGGDLDNRLPPRLMVVFEGLIATLPSPEVVARFDFYARVRAWKRAVELFELDEHTGKVLWDLAWRKDMKFDVATFLPERAAKHVEPWLDKHGLPYSNVRHYLEPAALGRLLATMPDVYAVVHPDERHRFTYGHRGMLATQGWSI